ncbi:transcriptional regulator [Rhizobium sp. KVB221]|uniref:Transcriptional regulator n=1 Tax=Rhizobium setariae TaxID=2801340 RepID=A0A936YQ55_9HYPH|nr:transcriptional regulator [Rhizobium setariae]MBL0370756.1 transcriptional regulator [Rhizobium setariae]
MTLTKEIKKTIRARIQSDEAFRLALLSKAVEVLLSGDLETAKGVLWDYIEATIGFEDLSLQSGLSERSLKHMFSDAGNPSANHIFKVINILQKSDGIHLAVSAAA